MTKRRSGKVSVKAALFLAVILFSYPDIAYCKKKEQKNVIKNNLEQEHINGDVISIQEKLYNVLNQKNDLLSNIERFYDEHGNVKLINTYDKEGAIPKQSKFRYDEAHRLTGTLDSSSKGFVTFTLFRKDSKGRDTGSAFFTRSISKPELLSQNSMTYDNNNNLTELRMYNGQRLLTSKTESVYDKNGNVVILRSYNADETLKEKFVYTYDKNGNKTTTSNYDAQGKLKNKYTFVYSDYDSHGNWLKFTRYQNDQAQIALGREIKYK